MIGAPRLWKDKGLAVCCVKKTEMQFVHLWVGVCDGCYAHHVWMNGGREAA